MKKKKKCIEKKNYAGFDFSEPTVNDIRNFENSAIEIMTRFISGEMKIDFIITFGQAYSALFQFFTRGGENRFHYNVLADLFSCTSYIHPGWNYKAFISNLLYSNNDTRISSELDHRYSLLYIGTVTWTKVSVSADDFPLAVRSCLVMTSGFCHETT